MTHINIITITYQNDTNQNDSYLTLISATLKMTLNRMTLIKTTIKMIQIRMACNDTSQNDY
jgi:hypothetical protein